MPLPISSIESADGIGKIPELITVKFAIPEQEIFVRTEPRAITQCHSAVLSLDRFDDGRGRYSFDRADVKRAGKLRDHRHVLKKTAQRVQTID